MYRSFGKRLFDLALTVPALVVSAPALAAVAAVVRLGIGSPVVFRQERAGLHGSIFTLHKFRTMTDARDATGRLLPDDERLTALGRFLRSTSLDELPELFDVLRGEMSLVGPRPLLAVYLERYSPEQRRRLEVRPGMTGWAQINGRNGLDWDQKFAFDLEYVERQSLWLDVKILLLTLVRIVQRDGISMEGRATADEFMGNVK